MTTLSSLYFILFPFLFRGSKKREKRFELPPLKSYYNTYTSYVQYPFKQLYSYSIHLSYPETILENPKFDQFDSSLTLIFTETY